ncbi:MAG: hypothetical protein CL878_07265 [Dehalococcoidia bacterium]|nr:hypothetical protein [Dehalococcoidia bacterium]
MPQFDAIMPWKSDPAGADDDPTNDDEPVTEADARSAPEALGRLIQPARALKEELQRSIEFELYAGTGDMAIQSCQGLQRSITEIVDDPYVASLALSPTANATDKEKIALALLTASQLLAYLEGRTGATDTQSNQQVRLNVTYHGPGRKPASTMFTYRGPPESGAFEAIEKMIRSADEPADGEEEADGHEEESDDE